MTKLPLKSSTTGDEDHERQTVYRGADRVRVATGVTGTPVADVWRQIGVSEASFYLWKKKFGQHGLTDIREMRQLRDANARLKRFVADLMLHKQILGEVVRREL